MTSPKQVTRSVLLADGCDMNHNVQALANEIVSALRDAGYLIEGVERQTEYGMARPGSVPYPHANAGWRHKSTTHQRYAYLGPWRPVEEESNDDA